VEKTTGSRPKLWNDVSPRMSLNEWRKLNSWGSRSIEAESAEVSISQDLVLSLDLGRAARQLNTAPVEGPRRDFFGDHLPEQGALAGPFQRLGDGKNSLLLWRPARRSPP
jgi:hypothetical protein